MSSSFGELVLVLGDSHTPQKTTKIPAPFQRMLVPNKMQHVLCTGNISMEQYRELQSLAPSVHVVAGDYDDYSDNSTATLRNLPEHVIVKVGAFTIGLIHGHQLVPWNSPEALERMQRKLQVDILITGHSHQNNITILPNQKVLLNPGSITGAYSPLVPPDNKGVTPSFVLLAVQDTKVVCYVYELGMDGTSVDVSKTEFTKATTTTKDDTHPNHNPALLQSLLT